MSGAGPGSPDTARDDGEIFAALGRTLLGWGQREPDISQFAIFYRPEGDGYVDQFPWAELGVTPLPPGQPDSDNMRFFTQPTYRDGGNVAEVGFVTRLVARDDHGRAMPPYLNQVNLTLRKTDGRWTLIDRQQGPMT